MVMEVFSFVRRSGIELSLSTVPVATQLQLASCSLGICAFVNCKFAGAVWVQDTAVFDNVLFEDNMSRFIGGALWIDQSDRTGAVTIRGSHFVSNEAPGGAAVAVKKQQRRSLVRQSYLSWQQSCSTTLH